jgi:arylsulfatase A-like enzyme
MLERPEDTGLHIAAPLVLALALLFPHASYAEADTAKTAPKRPNVLWIVWDTVRADHMSLYGHSRATTPKLEEWAKGARVFDDVVSAASTTTPSHASMFTGLLPTQHGANNAHRWLEYHHVTIAELLKEAGYSTYLWAANPHISKEENFQQGFDHEAHPWDAKHRKRATEIVRSKMEGDRTSEVGDKHRGTELAPWSIKAAGELAEVDLLQWLGGRETDAPFFAFINYMEAHRPFIPRREARQKVMPPEMVDKSYRVDRSWIPMWTYTFGLAEYSEEELELMARTYDATLIELDDLFANLLESLEARGYLENTVIILAADHGEHLGEQHMMDHQYSLYAPVINVPLLIHYPEQFEPGRDARPVMNFDIFPTILDLAALEPPANLVTRSRTLLDPEAKRVRVSEYPAVFKRPQHAVQKKNPTWDPARFARQLRSLREHSYKLIRGDDGSYELYDVASDPHEQQDLVGQHPKLAKRLTESLDSYMAGLSTEAPGRSVPPQISQQQREMLQGLGYLLDENGDAEADAELAEPAPPSD